jgi:hypothetical protein
MIGLGLGITHARGRAASGGEPVELVRTDRGNDTDIVANALTVGPFTPAAGSLLVAVWMGFRSGANTPNPTFTADGQTWTEKTVHINATSLDWDPCLQFATAEATGSEITVSVSVASAAHRHGLVVVEYNGHAGIGAYGTLSTVAPTGTLGMTLDGAATEGSEVFTACLLRNWVGTASTIGIAANGEEVYRRPSLNGSEVDELFMVAQAITGWETDTQAAVWTGVDGNNSNSNQGFAAVALEILKDDGQQGFGIWSGMAAPVAELGTEPVFGPRHGILRRAWDALVNTLGGP